MPLSLVPAPKPPPGRNAAGPSLTAPQTLEPASWLCVPANSPTLSLGSTCRQGRKSFPSKMQASLLLVSDQFTVYGTRAGFEALDSLANHFWGDAALLSGTRAARRPHRPAGARGSSVSALSVPDGAGHLLPRARWSSVPLHS